MLAKSKYESDEIPNTNAEHLFPMNFAGARNYIVERLSVELASNLYYHGLHHTLDVCRAVEHLARKENVTGNELVLLQTAAYFHDAGFLEQYRDNEPIAVRIAGETLPRFDYSREQVEVIENIILATRLPQRPHTHLEQIMCDADLDYLGREDYHTIANSLKSELIEYGIIQVQSEKEWNALQANFLQKHVYFTRTAQASREPLKQQHLTEIRQKLGS